MPTYNYKCLKCDGVNKIFQGMNDSPLEQLECNICNKKTNVERIIVGGSGMIFKGTGFYLTDYTDYRKQKKTNTESSEKLNKEKNKKDIKKKG